MIICYHLHKGWVEDRLNFSVFLTPGNRAHEFHSLIFILFARLLAAAVLQASCTEIVINSIPTRKFNPFITTRKAFTRDVYQ
jgi:hypothetical protein